MEASGWSQEEATEVSLVEFRHELGRAMTGEQAKLASNSYPVGPEPACRRGVDRGQILVPLLQNQEQGGTLLTDGFETRAPGDVKEERGNRDMALGPAVGSD